MLQKFRRSASAALLLNGREQQQEHDDTGDVELEEQGGTSSTQTPLEATLTKIGFGAYQKKLLILCGFGWLADNMWLQAVAVILPRVQDEFQVSDRWIGMLSSSTFTGMMIGAWSWGSYSDSFGRRGPFNGTLLLTSCFGVLAGFASSFTLLCLCFFGLGLGVGGSMPTDGTLFLENLPEEYHFLLTGLSVFFSLGAIFSSTLGLIIIPSRSCPEHATVPCDVATQNTGWRILLGALAVVTLVFCTCRIVLFKLHESPKYLVNSGQTEEAVIVLQSIIDHNGSSIQVQLSDVQDDEAARHPAPSKRSFDYNSVSAEDPEQPDAETSANTPRRRSAKAEATASLRKNVQDYLDRVSDMLDGKRRRITLLVWAIWFTVSAAYTIFNVFLPKFLEEKLGKGATSSSRIESLQEYCIYTVAGFPGSLVGAYLEKHIGQRESMAVSTFATAIGILGFAFVSATSAVTLVSIWISFSGTLMYAVIYGYTPRLFPVAYRGSATGIASALSRLAGMTLPLVTGVLLAISTSLPLYVSAGLFMASAAFMLPLQN